MSRQERVVLALMAEGHSNREIGQRLLLSARTVEAHVRNIFIRLDLAPEPRSHRRVLAVLSYLRHAGAG